MGSQISTAENDKYSCQFWCLDNQSIENYYRTALHAQITLFKWFHLKQILITKHQSSQITRQTVMFPNQFQTRHVTHRPSIYSSSVQASHCSLTGTKHSTATTRQTLPHQPNVICQRTNNKRFQTPIHLHLQPSNLQQCIQPRWRLGITDLNKQTEGKTDRVNSLYI